MKNLLTIAGVCLLIWSVPLPSVHGESGVTQRKTHSGTQQGVNRGKSPQPTAIPFDSRQDREAPTSVEPPDANRTTESMAATNRASGETADSIPWHSLNGGGSPVASPDYSVNGSFGQSFIGLATSAAELGGVGYWYGVCSCPFQCDYDEDGFLTALDLGALIDVLFAGRSEIRDASCVTSRGDFDTDGFPTALDLSGLIDHLFAGGPPPGDPCEG